MQDQQSHVGRLRLPATGFDAGTTKRPFNEKGLYDWLPVGDALGATTVLTEVCLLAIVLTALTR